MVNEFVESFSNSLITNNLRNISLCVSSMYNKKLVKYIMQRLGNHCRTDDRVYHIHKEGFFLQELHCI